MPTSVRVQGRDFYSTNTGSGLGTGKKGVFRLVPGENGTRTSCSGGVNVAHVILCWFSLKQWKEYFKKRNIEVEGGLLELLTFPSFTMIKNHIPRKILSPTPLKLLSSTNAASFIPSSTRHFCLLFFSCCEDFKFWSN